MIVGLRGPLERDARELNEARRKGRRKDGIALDDAGIAVGRALPRLAAVNERHREAALDEGKGNRSADDPGAKHDNVTARQDNLRYGCKLK